MTPIKAKTLLKIAWPGLIVSAVILSVVHHWPVALLLWALGGAACWFSVAGDAPESEEEPEP